MNTDSTTFDNESMKNEETQFDNNQTNAKKQEKVTESTNTKRAQWVKIGGSAGAGLLLGAASVLLTSSTLADDTAEESSDNTSSTLGDSSVPIAENVNNDMSFSEAFAAARHEVGAGGAFEWRGNVYSTFYAEEWNSMTEEEKDDYFSHVNHTPSAYHAETHDTAEVVSVDDSQTHTTEQSSPHASTASHETAQMGTSSPVDDVEIEVLGVSHDDATGDNVVSMTVGGHGAILVDVDNNNTIDIMAMDVNDDGQVSENEIADVSDQGLTIDQFGTPTDPAGNMYASNDDLPDYVNDANIDCYDA